VSRRDRDAALALLGSVVDRIEERMALPATRFDSTCVIAAVNVVLPWST